LLEDASPKGPVIKLPVGTKILSPNNTWERTYFEGVHTHPSKVKFLPPKDAPKCTLTAFEAPCKRRKTVANLEKELEAQHATITSMEASLRIHSRCIIHTNEKLEDVKKDNKKLDKRVSALEPP
jgi:hypothetical protein